LTLEFTNSQPLTLGVELELQLVNRRDYNLTRAASDLLARLQRIKHGFDIKPEITESMIEIATGVHTDVREMLDELHQIRSLLLTHAEQMNIAICGGGAHPFQRWDDQRIFEAERYRLVSELYGYLAKQFTVYGQHIHIGCPTGDAAISLSNYLSRYLPDFIALSASSPYYQGVDTSFQSSRLTSVNAFPLSGRMPGFKNWAAFCDYFEDMRSLGIVESMKDFYWDLRPKPEYGTVEIRVCDSPICLETSVLLAAYAQALAAECFQTHPQDVCQAHADTGKVHSYNRFQACRFGLKGQVVNPDDHAIVPLGGRILKTIDRLMPVAERLNSTWALNQLAQRIKAQTEDSDWMREIYAENSNLSEVVRLSALRWSNS
jgi:glutamate---cysteine ligase / carboxylate-amine ligase